MKHHILRRQKVDRGERIRGIKINVRNEIKTTAINAKKMIKK